MPFKGSYLAFKLFFDIKYVQTKTRLISLKNGLNEGSYQIEQKTGRLLGRLARLRLIGFICVSSPYRHGLLFHLLHIPLLLFLYRANLRQSKCHPSNFDFLEDLYFYDFLKFF